MTILVADDTEDIRFLMRATLEHGGHQLVEAADGREAVELAARERPDVILMDLSMPVMDGVTATRHLRARPETSRVPIIAVTAHGGDPVWRTLAMAAGCNECVSKPVDFELLGGLIGQAVKA